MKHIGYLQAHGRPLPTYTGPPWRQREPEVPVTEAEVAAWRWRHEATCSDKVARCLATLERDFAPRDSLDARRATC